MTKKLQFAKSYQLYKRANQIILDGTQLYSKSARVLGEGSSPAYLIKGKGSHVWDVDGNEYIDYLMGYGTYALGYNFPAVNDAVKKQVEDGSNFTLTHPLEVEVAELIHNLIPSAGMMRFLKTGSGACTAAVRIARAFTGRELILKGEYHGWHDWAMAASKRSAGIPKVLGNLVKYVEYGDLEEYRKLFKKMGKKIAAVITEPHIESSSTKKEITTYLRNLKNLCHRYGTLLILDEVVDGFRYALGGAQEYYGVTPDLSTFGKAIANGYPLSVVVGRKRIFRKVQNKIFISTTFGGEAISLAAAKATITALIEKKAIDYIWKYGRELMNGIKKLIKKHDVAITLYGVPIRFVLHYLPNKHNSSSLLKAFVQQECISRGMIIGWYSFPSFSHTQEDLRRTLGIYDEVFALYKKIAETKSVKPYLRGRPPVAVEVL